MAWKVSECLRHPAFWRAGRWQAPVRRSGRSGWWLVGARRARRSCGQHGWRRRSRRAVNGSWPTHETACAAGQRPAPLVRGSLQCRRDTCSLAALPHWHTRSGPPGGLHTAPAAGDGGDGPWIRPGYRATGRHSRDSPACETPPSCLADRAGDPRGRPPWQRTCPGDRGPPGDPRPRYTGRWSRRPRPGPASRDEDVWDHARECRVPRDCRRATRQR
jgi:hypothetical protein